jgi:hypothetical protein
MPLDDGSRSDRHPVHGPLVRLHVRREPPRQMVTIDIRLVQQQPSLLGAIKLCIGMAGFESDKQVYMHLGIDAGHWSRITRGEAHFPLDKLGPLMDFCGNEAPLLWLLDDRGYEVSSLRRKETELEQQLRLAREEIAHMKAERGATLRAVNDLIASGALGRKVGE